MSMLSQKTQVEEKLCCGTDKYSGDKIVRPKSSLRKPLKCTHPNFPKSWERWSQFMTCIKCSEFLNDWML